MEGKGRKHTLPGLPPPCTLCLDSLLKGVSSHMEGKLHQEKQQLFPTLDSDIIEEDTLFNFHHLKSVQVVLRNESLHLLESIGENQLFPELN